MEGSSRRTFLKVLTGAAAAGVATQIPLRAFADPPMGQNEFFIFIHASGAWDVMLWADPRNEERGLIDPPNTGVVDEEGIRNWTSAPMAGDIMSFVPVRPSGSNLTFGPAIGELASLYDRVTVVNGLAVNTVSHPDGTYFASTGRHLAGGKPAAASIDTMVANEFGQAQLFPSVSVQFPSTFMGEELSPRSSPLRLATVDTVSKVLNRQNQNTVVADRDAVTALLTQEAQELSRRSHFRGAADAFAMQYESLRNIHRSDVRAVFDGAALRVLLTDACHSGAATTENSVKG